MVKKILLATIFFISCGSLIAQTSDLDFFTEGGENFTLYVNGEKINEQPKSKVIAENISGDMAAVKIIFEQEGLREIKSSMLIDMGNYMVTVIKKNKKGKYVFRPVSSEPKGNYEMVEETTMVEVQPEVKDLKGTITAKVEGKQIILEDGRVLKFKHIPLNGTTRVSLEMKAPVDAQVTLSYDGEVVKSTEVPFNYIEMDYKKNNAYIKLEVTESDKNWSVKLKNMNGYRIEVYQ